MAVSGGVGLNIDSIDGSRRRARETRERSERNVHGWNDATFLGVFIEYVRIADGNESEKKKTEFTTFERLVWFLDEREARRRWPIIRFSYIELCLEQFFK